MKTLIIGNGWLGQMFKEYLNAHGHDAVVFSPKIETAYEIPSGIWESADYIVNCAAKTNIDYVEKHKLEAATVNIGLAVSLAQRCKETGKKYVFFSSACIFQSKDIHDVKYESSEPNPACFYSKTKALAEEIILQENPEALIIRPRLPISEVPHPRNTLNKILSYKKLHTNRESVTVVEDMFPLLEYLMKENESGAFNIVNEGTISPAEIADHFGHVYEKFSKEDETQMMKQEGRAQRVTTIVGSERDIVLPGINERMIDIVPAYNSHKV